MANAKDKLTKYLGKMLYADTISGENDKHGWADGIVGVMKKQGGNPVLFLRADLFDQLFTGSDIDGLMESGAVAEDLGAAPVRHLGATEDCVRIDMTALNAMDLSEPESVKAASEAERNRAEVRQLKQQLKAAHSALAEDLIEDRVSSMVTDRVRSLLEQKRAAVTARKLVRAKRGGDKAVGVPTLFISDTHFDEYVNPEEVEFMNEYSRNIAMERLDRVFDKSADLLFTHTSGVRYDELVVALGGDMVSGDIHDELARTNEAYTPDTVMDFSLAIAKNLKAIAQEFPSVYVPCVVGNHGRLTHKPSAKGRARNSFDYLMYRAIEALTADVENITFDISPSADLEYKVYDWTYRLTHGDQFRGGGGVGGIFPALLRTDMRKHKRNASLRREGYQYLIMGHFHRYSQQDGIIVNGTLKGVDEYTYTSNFDVQPPCQALWLTHPDYGITISMPVFADVPVGAGNVNAPPVTPSMSLRKRVGDKVAAAEAARRSVQPLRKAA